MDNSVVYGMIASLLVLCIGLLKLLQRKRYEKNGVKVQGLVSDLLLEYQGGTRAYYPVVSYRTLENIEFEEKSSFGTYPAAFKKGQEIDVIYDRADHKKFIIDSKKYVYIEVVSITIGLVGLIISCVYLMK
ncbi:DUF3592 domain-containing protein [Pedobacter polaris]|nr:DUF3592 domain-containing protein [Pedobacter polaris]